MTSRKREATRPHLCWRAHGLINTREWGGVRKPSQSRTRHEEGVWNRGQRWPLSVGRVAWVSLHSRTTHCLWGVIREELISPLSTAHAHIHPCTTRTLNFYSPFIYAISSYKHHPYPRLTAHDLYFENWIPKSFLSQRNPSIPHAPWSCYNMLYLLCTILWLLINSWQRNK